jgi:phosphoglycerate kinase
MNNIDLADKNVFLKVDMNSSFDPSSQCFYDTTKIRESLRSIEFCLENGARTVIVASHQGDQGKNETLKNHVRVLRQYLRRNRVTFANARCGERVVKLVKNAEHGEVIVLENTRTMQEEWACTDVRKSKMYKTLKRIPNLAGIKDDPASHRKELSSYLVLKQLKQEGYPVYGGLLLQKDMELARRVTKILKKKKSFAIFGGRKIKDYVELLPKLFEKFPNMHLLLGGLFSIYMEKAKGNDVGHHSSLWKEKDEKVLPNAKGILKNYGERIRLPKDYFILNGKSISSLPAEKLAKGKAVDIGMGTIQEYKTLLKRGQNRAVLINGALGVYELASSVHDPGLLGASRILTYAFNNGHTVMGFGGDSTAVFNKLGFKPEIQSSSGKAFFKRIVYGPDFDCDFLR